MHKRPQPTVSLSTETDLVKTADEQKQTWWKEKLTDLITFIKLYWVNL